MSKKILVVGGGGREHAIIKKLKENSDLPISDINTRGDLALFLERADFSYDAEKALEELEASLK